MEIKGLHKMQAMNDKKLIHCVKKHPLIYDLSHEEYLDIKRRAKLWKEIGEELNQPHSLCKSRWQNIRDNFRKHLLKNPASGRKKGKYKYEDILSFLVPQFSERDALYNKTIPENNAEMDELDVNEEIDDSQSSQPDQTLQLSQRTSTPINYNVVTVNKDSNNHQKKAISSKVVEYILDKERKESRRMCDHHPIDAFLSGIAPTLKGFSPYYQHVAKGKIFEIVQEMELNQLQNEANLPQSLTPETSYSWSSKSTPTMQAIEDVQVKGKDSDHESFIYEPEIQDSLQHQIHTL